VSALRGSVRVLLERGEYAPAVELAAADHRVVQALVALAGDESPARIYEGGQLMTKQVREWAGEARSRLRAA